jgi:tetratricopeptide (TPR) repeat protein
MNARPSFAAFLLLSLPLYASAQTTPPPSTDAQPSAATPGKRSYDDDKAFAMELFKQKHYLEALPVFEDLAKRNPNDATVLIGLGAGMAAQAATLQNPEAAKQERIKAREILLRAKSLGSNDPLLLNLLDTSNPDGATHFEGSPAFQEAINAGEAAFAKSDFDEALTNYSKAAELDPKSYVAALFVGDSYFRLKNIPKAAEWYDKAIQIDPNRNPAYRYEADMWTKNGNQPLARTLAIRAVVAEPYAQISWRSLQAWTNANKVKFNPVHINTHSSISPGGNGQTNITLTPGPAMSVWMIYNGVRLEWQKDKFKAHYPQEQTYRHTLEEEVDALSTAASMLKTMKAKEIEADPDLATLKKLSDADMLAPYVLFGAADKEIALDYVSYRDKNRAKLEEYLDKFIVPPAPKN